MCTCMFSVLLSFSYCLQKIPKGINNLTPICYFISCFIIGCQHLVHAIDMMSSSRFSRLFRGFLIFQLIFFFGNDDCRRRINRLQSSNGPSNQLVSLGLCFKYPLFIMTVIHFKAQHCLSVVSHIQRVFELSFFLY